MERQNDDGSHETEQATQQLSLAKHFQVVLGTILIFAVFTFIIILALPQAPAPDDKLGSTVRYGALTGIEIVVVLCLQSLLVDKVIDGKGNVARDRFHERAAQFGIRRPRNGKLVARDTLLLLFCALVPLDALSYAIPGVLGYVSETSVGQFFEGFTWETFLTIGIVYNLITGVKEEFVFRGYFLQRFKEHGTRHTSWILSSLLFGLLHVQLSAILDFPLGPLVWFATAFLVGLLFSGYALNTNRMLPLVLAHGIGNFISAGAIWAYHAAGGLSTSALGPFLLTYYGPMLVAGIILAIVFNKTILRAYGASYRLGRALVTRATGRDSLVIIATLLALWAISFLIYL
jgi:membrane protease YdiL (CAAX protease family)